ncbi:MAG: tetratricopeptide repeat protein [Deltaproteobacteria bacterium]|nr:tetratricopeptide repeat protein [Deltaproteobacteria bacterium]
MRRRLAWLVPVIAAGVALRWVGGRAPAPAPPAPVAAPLPADDDTEPASAEVVAADEEDGDDDPRVAAAEPAEDEAEQRNRAAVARADAGDLDQATALLRDARRLAPENELYRTNLQAVLMNAAFTKLRDERFREAIPRFTEALALGDRGEIRRGLGYAYYRTNEPEQARANLERAVTQGAADAETYLTLGRIHLDRHDQANALAMLREAVAAGADSPGLADTVARLERDAAAEADYHSLGSSHFVIKIEGREDSEAARTVLNALEDAYRRVGARFAYYPLERLEVVLYPDETFREVTGSPHWSGGIYDGRIKMPIGGLARGNERLARTVRHEYAHAAIVTLSKGKAPVWLNEGLAQVAEETDDAGRTNRLRMAVADGNLLALGDLENGFTRFDRDQASLAYSQAYFAAKYLLDHKGAYNVRRLLEAMATADGSDAAFKQALGMTYLDFERHLRAALERAVG